MAALTLLSFAAVIAVPRTFYRVVRTDPPTLRDFTSNAALGKQPRRPLSLRERDRWNGVSHFDSFEAAVEAIRRYPTLGNFIATVVVPRDAEVRIQQTGRDERHYTIWAPPDALLDWVPSVALVRRLQ